MILYCDTSALLKLYIAEPFSGRVKARLAEAEAVAVCRISWAEAHAALARRAREVAADAEAIAQAKQALARDWPHYAILDADQALVEQAGEFASAFALRGYDSVQLAAAHRVSRVSQTTVCFACFDVRLNQAAKALGMTCL